MSTFFAKHITISIARPADEVYTFIANPENLPRWASGLSNGVEQRGDVWVSESPMGEVTVSFAPTNPYGVVDHDVTLGDDTFYNPMRVISNNDGCEVVFTLFRRPEMSDDEFAADQHAIETDLQTLKDIFEG